MQPQRPAAPAFPQTAFVDGTDEPMGSSDTSLSDTPRSSSAAAPLDSRERKRERNREWMRRARLRKRSQQSDVHMTVSALELQRDALMKERDLDEEAVENLLRHQHDTRTKIDQYRQLNRAYTETEQTLGALREDNFTLREEMRRRRVAATLVGDLVEELRQADHAPIAHLLGDTLSFDEFQWFNEIESFYEPIAPHQIDALVCESYAEVMEYVAIAQSCVPSAHDVLGWNDRRLLDGAWSNFFFDKPFAHQSPFELMQKTWQLSTDLIRIRVLQPKTQRLKILQVLNENTLVVARQNYFPNEDTNLCSVYVLFRIETPDHGFVIATRSIEPYRREAMAKYRASGRHLFVRLTYTFQFHQGGGGGSHVTFGGRVNNVQPAHARNCLLDAILAMLRWEAHCVAPLLTLHG